jgi:hypothetical protein
MTVLSATLSPVGQGPAADPSQQQQALLGQVHSIIAGPGALVSIFAHGCHCANAFCPAHQHSLRHRHMSMQLLQRALKGLRALPPTCSALLFRFVEQIRRPTLSAATHELSSAASPKSCSLARTLTAVSATAVWPLSLLLSAAVWPGQLTAACNRVLLLSADACVGCRAELQQPAVATVDSSMAGMFAVAAVELQLKGAHVAPCCPHDRYLFQTSAWDECSNWDPFYKRTGSSRVHAHTSITHTQPAAVHQQHTSKYTCKHSSSCHRQRGLIACQQISAHT